MTDEKAPEPDGRAEEAAPTPATPQRARRAAPRPPGGDTEKALGLEVARLFGLSPRLLMAPRPAPADAASEEDEPD
jgi:hypothetical protein